MMQDAKSHEAGQHEFVKAVHGVRYQVKDVRSLDRVLYAAPRVHAETPATPCVRERRTR